MGPLEMTIYRSFVYTQTGEIEEYKDDSGSPYWYNKRTGETYWEPPLDYLQDYDEDSTAVKGIDEPLERSDMRRQMLLKHEEQMKQGREVRGTVGRSDGWTVGRTQTDARTDDACTGAHAHCAPLRLPHATLASALGRRLAGAVREAVGNA